MLDKEYKSVQFSLHSVPKNQQTVSRVLFLFVCTASARLMSFLIYLNFFLDVGHKIITKFVIFTFCHCKEAWSFCSVCTALAITVIKYFCRLTCIILVGNLVTLNQMLRSCTFRGETAFIFSAHAFKNVSKLKELHVFTYSHTLKNVEEQLINTNCQIFA